jgi:anti-sigma regulatory factor (Ser/Thr protein kinase)
METVEGEHDLSTTAVRARLLGDRLTGPLRSWMVSMVFDGSTSPPRGAIENPADPRREPDGASLQITLERDPLAPARARAAVASFTERSEIAPDSLDTLSLLVSELVSNAVLHSDAPGASAIRLCARLLGPDAVRIEVTDEGSGFTAVPRDPTRIDGGYGLFLVDTQATSWGIDRRFGNCVWFEVAESPAGARP